MNISKAERYAMIRRAAVKVQKRNKILQSNSRLAEEVIKLDEDDTNKEINYETNDAYINAYFSDVLQANTNREDLF